MRRDCCAGVSTIPGAVGEGRFIEVPHRLNAALEGNALSVDCFIFCQRMPSALVQKPQQKEGGRPLGV
jgi:hypothetical protein